MTNACCRPVLQARKQLGRHALHYGLDVNRLDNETQSLSTDRGVTTAVPKGPDTTTTRWGFCAGQHRAGPLHPQAGPALRIGGRGCRCRQHQHGRLGATAVSKRFDAWLPQLGGQVRMGGGVQLFANYARGSCAHGR
jgi:hemoglobin/transferrin/lactoferrin receptor protein